MATFSIDPQELASRRAIGDGLHRLQRHRSCRRSDDLCDNIGNNEVPTFSPAGQLIRTENAVQAGNDGLMILADGTKYVSSVQNGGVSRIRRGRRAELIAQSIPNPTSMCYDVGANQLVIPMNANNALAFITLN